MSKLTPYQTEYRKYLATYQNYPLIMPCFIEYLRDKRDEAGKRKQWAKYEYFSDLIQEDIEDDGYRHEEAQPTWDSDKGL